VSFNPKFKGHFIKFRFLNIGIVFPDISSSIVSLHGDCIEMRIRTISICYEMKIRLYKPLLLTLSSIGTILKWIFTEGELYEINISNLKALTNLLESLQAYINSIKKLDNIGNNYSALTSKINGSIKRPSLLEWTQNSPKVVTIWLIFA
jgi:hypothetical protein